MANFSIDAVRERLFNTTKHEKTVARTSNPFAASSFKGNILTADVFASEKSNSSMISFTGKLKASTLVSSLSDMSSKLHSGIESAIAFGRRMKDSVVGAWRKLDEIEVSIANPVKSIKESWNAMRDERMVQKYMSITPGEAHSNGGASLECMLQNELGLSLAA